MPLPRRSFLASLAAIFVRSPEHELAAHMVHEIAPGGALKFLREDLKWEFNDVQLDCSAASGATGESRAGLVARYPENTALEVTFLGRPIYQGPEPRRSGPIPVPKPSFSGRKKST